MPLAPLGGLEDKLVHSNELRWPILPMGRRLALAFLVVLVTVAGPCSASRKLQQNDAAAGLAAVPAAAAASLEAELPAAAPATVVSNIQLNAPGTSDLLSAPALAPASGPLPAGIVSLQAKNGGSVAQQTAQLNEQMERAAATPQTRIPVSLCLPLSP